MQFDPQIIKNFRYDEKLSYLNQLTKAEKFIHLKQAISENWFFEIYNLNNLESDSWQEVDLEFSASNFLIVNDSSDIAIFSWDGNDVSGILNAGESLPFNQLERNKIFLKSNGKLRIWCY